MAMESARPPRRIWQLPTFLLGLTAVWAAVTNVTPPPTASAKLGDKLDNLAAALDRKPVDVTEVENLVRLLTDAPQPTPRSHYLLGSGYVAIATLRPTESVDLWQLALQHFEICDANSLDPLDTARMNYRGAKARAAVGKGDAAGLIATLMNSPPGEDRSEVHRLIAECALRLTPPDLTRARDEFTNYLAGQNRASPAAADRCKLKLAELNTALNAPDQARNWLKDISASAPAEVLATAKVSLARQAYAEKNWPEAVALLEAALATPGLAAGEKGTIRFQIAEALSKLGNSVQAVAYYEQASRDNGPLGGQASLRLAELRIADPTFKGKRGDSVDWLERASVTLGSADAETVTKFKLVVNTCLIEGDYANALRAVTAQSKLSGDSESKLKAEVNGAWGTALKKANDPAANAKLITAADYYSAIGIEKSPNMITEFQLAVPLYQAAGEHDKALKAINRILNTKSADRTTYGKLMLKRAELLPATDFLEIKTSLEEAMNLTGPDANQARFKLGMLYVNRSQELLDKSATATNGDALRKEATQVGQFGQSLLRQCADMATVPAENLVMHEQATFELGRLHLRDGKTAEAEARFKKQLAVYPNGGYAGYGRLWLVCALLQDHKADPTNKRLLEEALTHLKTLTLSKDDYLRTYGEIWTANTLIEIGDLAAALPVARGMMEKHKGKPEELVAGKLLFHIHLKAAPPETADAARVLDRMEQAFAGLAAAAYPNDPEYSQAKWKTELPRLREELRKFQ